MYIESLTLRNFRCFGGDGTRISFRPGITAFVGDNGSGKTAALDALKRLFSPSPSERLLRRSDVYFGSTEDSQQVTDREVVIDVVFGISDQEDLPYVFKDIFFNSSDKSLKVRVMLEGQYREFE